MGGVERYLLYLSNCLTKKGFSSIILTRYYPPLPKKENHTNYTLYRIGLSLFPKVDRRYISGFQIFMDDHFTYSFLGFYEAIKYMRIEKINIVHPQLGGPTDVFLGMKLASKFRKPLIITVHGRFGYYPGDILPSEDLISILKQADFVIVNRKSAYDFLVNRNICKVTVMQNPVPVHEYKKPKNFNRIQTEKIRLLFIGRLTYRRGPHIAIQAFIHAAKENSDIELWVVGDGPLKSSLIKSVEKADLCKRVTFVGKQIDVRQYLWNSDIFLATSPIENFPSLSLREAMAAGLSVIATDVGETREIIRHNENGVIVPPEPKKVAEAILALASDEKLRQRLAGSANEYAKKKFDISSYCSDLVKIYRLAMH